jgi:hypothetical protein
MFFLVAFLFIFFVLNYSYSYTIAFSHYNQFFKKYVTYFLFEDRQLITDYKDYVIYEYNYPSANVFNELYSLKNVVVPSFYKPPLSKENLDRKAKRQSLGSIAYIYKDNQVMYLLDYSTLNFYKFLDYNLRGLIVSLEDNIAYLFNNISQCQKIEYKTYLDYVRAFGNLSGSDFELLLVYTQGEYFVFEFLNKENNVVKVVNIDKYYRFYVSEKNFPSNEDFKF